jgi:pre-mRNA-splicing factor SYF1
MLRIKRSVQAQYNTDIGLVAASAQGGQAAADTNGAIDTEGDAMAALERAAPLSGFVESTTGPVGGGAGPKEEKKDTPADVAMDNPDAIELGDDDEMQD